MKKLLAILALSLAAATASAQNINLFHQVYAPGSVGTMYYTSTSTGLISQLAVGGSTTCLWGGTIPNYQTCGTITGVSLTVPVSTFSITGSGATSGASSMAVTFQTQSAGTFLAGPATGGSATPAWRIFNIADFQHAALVFGAAGGSHSYGIVPDPGATPHTPKWYLDESGAFSATPGGGTVTSVDFAAPSGFTSSGGPVTGAGTLTLGFGTTTAANRQIFATDGSTNGIAGWRTMTGSVMAAYFPDFTTTTHGIVPPSTGCSGGSCTLYDNGWGASAAGGTVTSVGVVAPLGFTSTGGPITASGNITLGFAASGITCHYCFLSTDGGGALNYNDVHTGFANIANYFSTFSAGHAGIVPDPVTATGSQTLYDNGWGPNAAGGTVTSVAMTAPTGFSVTGSPVTVSGTLALAFASLTGTGSLAKFPGSPCGGGAGTVVFRILCATDLPPFVAAGGSHAPGAVPDPGSTSHSPAFYLGDDAAFHTMPYTGTVTSVDLSSSIGWITASGGPVTVTGTLNVAATGGQTANRFVRTPDGTTGPVALGPLAPGDLAAVPCASAARGTVPATGGGTTAFLRADCTFAVPGAGATIEVKQIGGVSPPDYTGVSVLEVDQASGLILTQPNGAGTARIVCSSCGGGGSAAQKEDDFAGDGSTTAFTASSTPASGGTIAVTLNGLTEITSAYSVSGSTLTMGSAPLSGATLSWIYFTTIPSSQTPIQEDFTATAAQTDFVLAHTPVSGTTMVYSGGLFQPLANYSIVSGSTVRFGAGQLSGQKISVIYRY